ncbi:MAG: AI-2E family transporter [Cyclobacteriaceae bacterium]|nr:AI-2E family transporter [Cyclobacteriaceae bacterium]
MNKTNAYTMKESSFNRLDYTFKVLMITAIAITVVVLARDIVIPMLIAGILTIVLLPLVKRLERKLPTVLAILIVLICALIIIVAGGMLIVNQLSSLIRDLPELTTKINITLERISTSLDEELGISSTDQNQLWKETVTSLSKNISGLFAATTNVISLLVQIPIYIFLFLIYRDRFKAFFKSLLNDSDEQKWKADIENVVQGYITGLLLVTLIVTILNSVGLLILGINHAIFFGIISGVLTIIPYLGIFIGAALPVIVALITKDSLWYPAGVIIIFSFVQFLEANFITPRITGSKVSINALAAIISLLVLF